MMTMTSRVWIAFPLNTGALMRPRPKYPRSQRITKMMMISSISPK